MTTAINASVAIADAARATGRHAYLNMAPRQVTTGTYYVFAFRSDGAPTAFEGAARKASEAVEVYAYSNEGFAGKGAIQALFDLIHALGRQVIRRYGLDTGATDSNFHFARMRIDVRPAGD